MICPYCGSEIGDSNSFCTQCGKRLDAKPAEAAPPEYHTMLSAADEPVPDYQTMPSVSKALSEPQCPDATAASEAVETQEEQAHDTRDSQTPAQPSLPSLTSLPKTAIVAGAALLAALLWLLIGKGCTSANATPRYDVEMRIAAPGLDETGTRTPIQVKGTLEDSTMFEEITYVYPDSSVVSLPLGSYEVSVVASPISGEGAIYEVPADPIPVTLSLEEKEAATPKVIVEAPVEPEFELTEIPADEVTDEQIAAALKYAEADEEATVDAQELAQVATTRRDEAVATTVEYRYEWQHGDQTTLSGFTNGKGDVDIWYPVFTTADGDTPATDAINTDVMTYVNSVAEYYNQLVAHKWGSCLMYPEVFWIDDTYVSIFYFITNSAGTIGTFAQRGWCEVYRLEDGQKVDAWELAGKEKSELVALGSQVLNEAPIRLGKFLYNDSLEVLLENMIVDFVVLDDGVYLSFPISFSSGEYAHTFLVGLCPLASQEGEWSSRTIDLFESLDHYRTLDRSHGDSLKVHLQSTD